ncbi:tRNA (uracil-5-)-methyltransferase [Anopheles sinensis]|uniref:tRNA (Uracil-5-)-methyltransferase n=1 Tax=Anopheles sinensis TaxID=74873 RepID=A0A084WFQ9_ANOSI|nr:tRNA (uracil-5-)-methyltransferase [Anopheles sinensis]
MAAIAVLRKVQLRPNTRGLGLITVIEGNVAGGKPIFHRPPTLPQETYYTLAHTHGGLEAVYAFTGVVHFNGFFRSLKGGRKQTNYRYRIGRRSMDGQGDVRTPMTPPVLINPAGLSRCHEVPL